MPSIRELESRLKQIELDIQEARRRLPAHSVKPSQMMVLFDLEDEREAILKQLKSMGQDRQKGAACH